MEQVLQFVIDNAAVLIELLGAAFLVVVAVIAFTKRKDDDAALLAFIDRLSPGARKAVGAGALTGILALVAALVSGCGHVPMPEPTDVAVLARIVACKACAQVDGERGDMCRAVLGCEP